MSLKGKVQNWFINRWIKGQVKEGTVFGKIWQWFDGKKLVVGSLIGVVSSIVLSLPVILPLFISDTAQVAQIVGVGLGLLGALHKLYKFIYKEDFSYNTIGQRGNAADLVKDPKGYTLNKQGDSPEIVVAKKE